MATYFEVDSAAFEAFLAGKGFTRTVSREEVVYVKEHLPKVWVKVYTSIATGNVVARDVGKDAIRVVAIFQKDAEKSYPLFKGSRVYRTTSQESVEERTTDRIVKAMARCDEWNAERGAKNAARQAEVATERAAEQGMHSRSEAAHERRRTVQSAQPEQNRRSAVQPTSTTMGEHFGKLGERARITISVVERKVWTDKFIFTMTDTAGHTFVYFSDKDLLQVGQMYDISCKLVAHGSFAGKKTTTIVEVAGKRVVL